MCNWASDEFNTDNGCGPHAALSLSQRWVILIRFHYFASLDNRGSIDFYHQQWASGKRTGQEHKSAESEQKALCSYPELCVEFVWSSQATSKWIRILFKMAFSFQNALFPHWRFQKVALPQWNIRKCINHLTANEWNVTKAQWEMTEGPCCSSGTITFFEIYFATKCVQVALKIVIPYGLKCNCFRHRICFVIFSGI